MLLRVLRAVSVPGSVFADTHPDAHLPAFLGERDSHRPNPGALQSDRTPDTSV